MVSRDIKFRFLGDSRDLQKASKDAAKAMSPITKSAETAQRKFDTLRTGIKLALGAAAVKTIAGFAGAAVTAASDIEESGNAVEVVFGDASSIIKDFAKDSASAIGTSTSEFQGLAATMGALLQNLGLDSKTAAKETIKLTKRASDMASVFNTTVPEAIAAISSALRGESDPIEKYGVKLNEAAKKAKALEAGLAPATGALDEQAKAAATLLLIFEQTDKIAGDFANTSDGLANKQRILDAKLENVKATIGKALIPAVTDLVNSLSDLIETPFFQTLLSAFENFALNFKIGVLAIRETVDNAFGPLDEILLAPFGQSISNDIEKNFLASLRDTISVAETLEDKMAGGAKAIVGLGREGQISARRLGILQESLGLTDDDMKTVIKDVIKFGKVNGVTDEAVGFLVDTLRDGRSTFEDHNKELAEIEKQSGDTSAATKELEDRNRDVAASLLDLASHMSNMETINKRVARRVLDHRDAVGELDSRLIDARKSQQNLIDVMREAVDPIFSARRATLKYQEVLAKIGDPDSPGGAAHTAEELLELLDAKLDLDSAFSRLQDADDLTAAIDGMARTLGISRKKVQELLVELGILDGKTFEAAVRVDVKIIGDTLDTSSGTITVGGTTSGGQIFLHDGGIVPGPRGAEVAAVLQAGERVISLRDQERAEANARRGGMEFGVPVTGGGGNIVQNITGPVMGPDAIRWIREQAVLASRRGSTRVA